MQVSVYDRNGLTNLPDTDGVMVAAGFSRGPKRELPYNPATRHFGLALEYVYLEEAAEAPGPSASNSPSLSPSASGSPSASVSPSVSGSVSPSASTSPST